MGAETTSSLAPTAAAYSANAVSFFVRLVEDIGRSLEPSDTQLATLKRTYRSTGEFLVDCPELKGHLESPRV
jgi:hypothetical protein